MLTQRWQEYQLHQKRQMIKLLIMQEMQGCLACFCSPFGTKLSVSLYHKRMVMFPFPRSAKDDVEEKPSEKTLQNKQIWVTFTQVF